MLIRFLRPVKDAIVGIEFDQVNKMGKEMFHVCFIIHRHDSRNCGTSSQITKEEKIGTTRAYSVGYIFDPWAFCGASAAIGKSSFYFSQLSLKSSFLSWTPKQINHLSQLLKPFILPPWSGYRWFSKTVLFFFYLFWLNF